MSEGEKKKFAAGRRKHFNQSPIGKVHNFGKFVLSSPTRRKAFNAMERTKQPELKKDLLPMMDVRTRWNQTCEAICRIMELKDTVIAFGNAHAEEECPNLNKDVCRALEVIQPALALFQILTKR